MTRKFQPCDATSLEDCLVKTQPQAFWWVGNDVAEGRAPGPYFVVLTIEGADFVLETAAAAQLAENIIGVLESSAAIKLVDKLTGRPADYAPLQ